MTLPELPSEVRLKKDQINGELIVLGSDGLDSLDQRQFGRVDQQIWTQNNPFLIELFRRIDSAFKNADQISRSSLSLVLHDILRDLRESQELYDDTTIGLICTDAFICRIRSENSVEVP